MHLHRELVITDIYLWNELIHWDTIGKITKYSCNTFADITKFYWDTLGERIKYYWYIFVQGIDITEIQLRK